MTVPAPELLQQTTDAIAAVHRRPVSLRKWQVTSAESILRGAKMSALIDGTAVETAVSVYSLLAPDLVDATCRTFLRSPLQTLARMDVLAGGDGKPINSVSELQQLARVIVQRPEHLPGIVHGVLAGRCCFGPRSGLIARAASRVAAVATGFDPRGLCVPESYFGRHLVEYRNAVESFKAIPAPLLELQLHAYLAGAAEAEAIAKQA
ncbi:hypothetical protein QVA66_04990 [Staphylococcus chromogenes]|nr:hypothetical protein [Staphylococcus chromogenes]